MTKIEALEKEVESLGAEELAKFRSWFAKYDADLWDEEIEKDTKTGKLDALAAAALAQHAKGGSTAL